MTYDDYQRRIIEAQEQWNRDRDWIYKTQSGYNNFEGETQPPHVTTPDSYDHLTLEEMQTAVSAMKPKLVDDAVTMWANIGLELQGSFETFKREFERTITGQNGLSGWTGTAAKAAKDAVNNYYEQSKPLATAATLTSLKLSEMKTGIEQTQALMPGLTDRPDIAGKTLPKDGVMKTDEYTQTEAEQEGRRILRTVYGQVAGQTDVGVPYMPTAPTIVDGPVVPVTPRPNPGGSPGSSGSGGDSGSGHGNGGPTGGDSGSGTGGQTGTEPSAVTSDATTPTSTNPQSTTPTMQSSSPTTATPTTAGTSGLGTSSPNSATPGIGNPSSGRTGSGSPGRGIASTPTTGTTAAASAARQSTTTAGRTGTSGMSGMGGAGQGKGRDEDRKKGAPDYLITTEHGEELTGLDSQPKTVPPVIGGDHDGAERY